METVGSHLNYSVQSKSGNTRTVSEIYEVKSPPVLLFICLAVEIHAKTVRICEEIRLFCAILAQRKVGIRILYFMNDFLGTKCDIYLNIRGFYS